MLDESPLETEMMEGEKYLVKDVLYTNSNGGGIVRATCHDLQTAGKPGKTTFDRGRGY